MNSRQRKTLQDLFAEPTLANIKWSRVESLVQALGGEVVERAGSRVMFVLNGVKGLLHRPHPGDHALRSHVRSVRRFLETAGVRPGEGEDDA